MDENVHCPFIPLKDLRSNMLISFISNLLEKNQSQHVREIYNEVLNHFGNEICKPDIYCPHYISDHPEFWHVIRLTLWDGKTKGDFDNDGKGNWYLVP